MNQTSEAEVKEQYNYSQTQEVEEGPNNLPTLAVEQSVYQSNSEESAVKEEFVMAPSNRKRKKPRMISYETLSQSQAEQGLSSKLEQSQVQLSQKASEIEPERPRPKRKPKLKPTDPQQQDLIAILMFIKKKLPHRALDQCIKKLYEVIKQRQNRQGDNSLATSVIAANSIVQPEPTIPQNTEKDSTEAMIAQNNTQMNISEPQIHESTSKVLQNHSTTFDRALFPGRKVSVYHQIAANIAAVSNQVYLKNKESVLAAIEMLQNNIDKLPIVSKPRAESVGNVELKNEPSQLNQTTSQEAYFKFNESQTRKKSINPTEMEKYQARRKIAQTFIKRGFGVTSKIDSQLPPLNLDFGRPKYKIYLEGIMISTLRKLESFLACQLQIVIKFLDMGQTRRVAVLLVNSRVHLDPNQYETFLKFMRIAFGIGDVMVSRSEAINLYVAAMRLLYGKNITMQALERMGAIENRRNLEAKLAQLKKYAQSEKKKLNTKQTGKYPQGNVVPATLKEHNPTEPENELFEQLNEEDLYIGSEGQDKND